MREDRKQDSRRSPEIPELILSPLQATQLLPQLLTLYLKVLWLPQELTASVGGIGLAQPEALAESRFKALANATDELCVDGKWNVVDEAIQTN
jgi:hypothetical protein